jgi:cytochrome c oxidase assembly protein subunit 15
MIWTRFQKLALIAFISVEVLIFVGAVVRATGSGLGCPDWPLCYGCWTPPTRAEDIDFKKLNIEKFRAKAARLGRDPASITPETLRAEFDPVATWVEYINRLTSLPVGLSVTALLIASFWQIWAGRFRVFVGALGSFALVLINAWLGARVVLSGLKPGIITLHMALAILLQCFLVYTAWRGAAQPWKLLVIGDGGKALHRIGLLLFALVVLEGVMGSQVREMTDHLAMVHAGEKRELWVKELDQTVVYLLHRSFSWIILGMAFLFHWKSGQVLGRVKWLERGIVGLVCAQMVLGVVLSQVGIVRIAQILHIGLSSLLVSGLFLWLLGSHRATRAKAVPDPVEPVDSNPVA